MDKLINVIIYILYPLLIVCSIVALFIDIYISIWVVVGFFFVFFIYYIVMLVIGNFDNHREFRNYNLFIRYPTKFSKTIQTLTIISTVVFVVSFIVKIIISSETIASPCIIQNDAFYIVSGEELININIFEYCLIEFCYRANFYSFLFMFLKTALNMACYVKIKKQIEKNNSENASQKVEQTTVSSPHNKELKRARLFKILTIISIALGIISLLASVILLVLNVLGYKLPIIILSMFIAVLMPYTTYVFFSEYTNRSFNKPISYNVDEIIKDNCNNGIIEIVDQGHGKWVIGNEYVFDISAYMFSKTYIVAWFIRNLNYKSYNNRQELLSNIAISLPCDYSDITLKFIGKNKTNNYHIVKNGKTYPNLFARIFISTKYYFFYMLPFDKNKHVYLTEEVYHTLNRKQLK